MYSLSDSVRRFSFRRNLIASACLMTILKTSLSEQIVVLILKLYILQSNSLI